MIDFENGVVIKLSKCSDNSDLDLILPLLVEGEVTVGNYHSVRDYVIFTNKRLIVLNSQGMTGRKKDFTSLPYAKIQAFSVETAGHFDMESELELWLSGVGKVRLEFTSGCNIIEIGKIIGEYVL